ncbi:MAG: alpha/beta fold hydrolase [Granulosicoccus sp.]|nr:alpha/beta fold hydrolase [Granulosicoccus sp.]
MSRLNIIQSGRGSDLVMLHGLFGNLDNFRSIAQSLEKHFHVTRIDLPGHGKSPSLNQLSIDSMADAVLAELDHLFIEQYHLLGHSLGGKVSMCMAGKPESLGLRRMCVVDIAPKFYPPHHVSILNALRGLELSSLVDRKQADDQLTDAIPDASIRAFLLKSLYRQNSEFHWRFDLERLHRDYPLIQQAPVIAKKIEQPTLFIKGGESNYLQNEDENLIRQLFTRPSLKVIEGAGHWPHAEKPAAFTHICKAFFIDI